MQLSNVSGNVVAGQATSLDVTSTDGGPVTWSSSLGSTFSPNPSTDGGSSDSSTTYTPAAAGTDIITATDGSGDTATGDIPVTAAGGGGGSSGGYTISAAGAAAVLAASQAMTGVDLTTTAACAPVMAMQTAWNSNGGTPALTVDGGYGAASAEALAAAASIAGQGHVPAAVTTFPKCGGSPTPPATTVTCPDGSVHPAGYVCPGSSPIQPSGGMPKWLKWLLIVLAAGAVGTIGYLIYKKQNGSGASEPKRRRSKRRRRVTRARKGKRR